MLAFSQSSRRGGDGRERGPAGDLTVWFLVLSGLLAAGCGVGAWLLTPRLTVDEQVAALVVKHTRQRLVFVRTEEMQQIAVRAQHVAVARAELGSRVLPDVAEAAPLLAAHGLLDQSLDPLELRAAALTEYRMRLDLLQTLTALADRATVAELDRPSPTS